MRAGVIVKVFSESIDFIGCAEIDNAGDIPCELLIMLALLLVFELKFPVLKMISTSVLSPTASTFFFRGAFVHPHPGRTSVIRRVSPPTLRSQNVCEMLAPCGT